MRLPPNLTSLLEDGFIEAVLRPLQSGKEALVFLVMSDSEERVAKVYKEANDRNFKNRSVYAEGRGTRNTRDQRAMKRRSTHGKSRDEAAWQSTEVEMLHRLHHAKVRVPTPFMFMEGVLILELIQDAEGGPAPRLGDLRVSAEEAIAIHDALLRDVVRMLCAGVVHGDLSEFNVLVDADGPVIIDLPQAVDASSNPNARKLLLRDVENLQRFVTRWVPGRKRQPFAAEMWALYEKNELEPDTELTGIYKAPEGKADTDMVLSLIEDAKEDEQWKRQSQARNTPTHGRGQPHGPSKRRKKKKPAQTTPAVPSKPVPRSSLSDLVARANAPTPPAPSTAKTEGKSSRPSRGRPSERRAKDSRPARSRGRNAGDPGRAEGSKEAPRGRGRSRSDGTEGESRNTSRPARPKRNEGTQGGKNESSPSREREAERQASDSNESPPRRRRRRRPDEGDSSRRERPASPDREPSSRRTEPAESSRRQSNEPDRRGRRSDSSEPPGRNAKRSESNEPTRDQGGGDSAPRKRRRRRRRPSGGNDGGKPPRSGPAPS